MTNAAPRILVHGGAGDWGNANPEDVLAGMREAVRIGWEVLNGGGTALDAVQAATIILEDHPLFDAGIGSFLNDQGEIEMDALITDGQRMDFGAIAAVKHVRNPIVLARHVMTGTPHRFFVAEGADLLAAEFGLPRVPNLMFVTEEEWRAFAERMRHPQAEQPGHGTVGAVALDKSGHMASATSTGGSPNKRKGRVGDVPIYGAGGYADDRYGCASSTGVGENIMRHLLSKHVVDLIAAGNPAIDAATNGVQNVAVRIPSPEVGIIVIDYQGNLGAAHTTSHMPIGWTDSSGEIQAVMAGPYTFS